MQKVKYALVLLLTAVLITLGALLPSIAARVQDAAEQGKVLFGDMEEIRLNLYELSALQKLYLIPAATVVDMSTDKTKLREEDMEQTIAAVLRPYIQNGLIPDTLDAFTSEYHPMLYYSPIDAELSNIVWMVSLASGEEQTDWQRIDILMDDKTGKILTINYNRALPLYDDWMLEDLLKSFYTVYLNELDLTAEEGLHREENANAEKRAASTTFRWGDAEYGEWGIEFLLSDNGFYNWIFDANMMANKSGT